jgi:hypothetical protein
MNRLAYFLFALPALYVQAAPAAAQREMLFGPEESSVPVSAPTRVQASTATPLVVLAPGNGDTRLFLPALARASQNESKKVGAPGTSRTALVENHTSLPRTISTESTNARPMSATTTQRANALPARDALDPTKTSPESPLAQAVVAESLNEQRDVGGTPPKMRVNPFERRRQLVKSLPPGPLIVVLPGLSSGALDNYRNDQNYLPVANFLSERFGQLLVPAYEGDLTRLREAITSRRYPIVHASVLMFDDLRRAGYITVAMNNPGVGAAFVVRTKSPIKRIAQLSGHSIAMDASGPISAAALAAIRAEGLDDTVRLVEASGPIVAQVLPRVLDGSVDAGIVSTPDVAAIERVRPGAVRILNTYAAGVTDGVWADPGRLDARERFKLAKALEAMGSSDDASLSLMYATGLPTRFKVTTAEAK